MTAGGLEEALTPEPEARSTAELRVPTAHDFPRCRACQMWKDAGASWPRPCKQHYGGEPND